jgi:hypothetical protein
MNRGPSQILVGLMKVNKVMSRKKEDASKVQVLAASSGYGHAESGANVWSLRVLRQGEYSYRRPKSGVITTEECLQKFFDAAPC